MIRNRKKAFIIIGILILLLNKISISFAFEEESNSSYGVVVSDSEIASEIGMKILKQGGNAIDAAIAVAFALAVVYPQAGNIGGGGFMLIRFKDGKYTSIDYREKAPYKAKENMFLDKEGKVIKNLSLIGPLSAGIPGTVSGLYYAWQHFGSLPWKNLINPAIELADKGFLINRELAEAIKKNYDNFKIYKETARIFLKENKAPLKEGEILIQKDLAKSLKEISEKGADGFYKGDLAERIIRGVNKYGGIFTMEDLVGYKPIEKEPIVIPYKDYRIYSMNLPSSGGILIYIIMKTIESYDIEKMKHNSAEYVHILSEIFKRAFAIRSLYLGDALFYNVPIKELLSEETINKIRLGIDPDFATPSSKISPDILREPEKANTTHFCVLDKFGNAVSNTYTLNSTFGSFFIPEGTGILLNNEMDDFSIKPGYPNQFGLIGSRANSIEAGKRMLSSMTPTIIEKDGKIVAILGSPGGSKIITAVLQVILNLVEFKMPLAKAVEAKRFHHQWLPDFLLLEKGFPQETINNLKNKGYFIKENEVIGSVNAIAFDEENKKYIGFADKRRGGKAIGLLKITKYMLN